jgi:transaldolase
MSMKFYLDTVSLAEIQEMIRLEVLDGITMNASLLTEPGLSFYEGIREICREVDRPVSVGVLSIEY